MEPAAPPRHVRCPRCGGDSLYAPTNRWRPFCSERCKLHDLGAWASGDYAVPATTPDLIDPESTPRPE